MPIYVSAALIEHRRDEIFAAEPEMPILHHLLNHVPESLDIEAVLQRARKLCDEYPPASIQSNFNNHVLSSALHNFQASSAGSMTICVNLRVDNTRCSRPTP